MSGKRGTGKRGKGKGKNNENLPAANEGPAAAGATKRRVNNNNMTQRRQKIIENLVQKYFQTGNVTRRVKKRDVLLENPNISPNEKLAISYQLDLIRQLQNLRTNILNEKKVNTNEKKEKERLEKIIKNIAKTTLKLKYVPYVRNVSSLRNIYERAKSTKKNLFPKISLVEEKGINAWANLNASSKNKLINTNTFLQNLPNLKIQSPIDVLTKKKYIVVKGSLKEDEHGTTILELPKGTPKEKQDRAKLNAQKFVELWRNGDIKYKKQVNKIFGDPYKGSAQSGLIRENQSTKASALDSIIDYLENKDDFNYHCTGDKLMSTGKGKLATHESHAADSTQCCSVFENGQVAHNIGSGMVESGQKVCGYTWTGFREPGTLHD